MLAVAWNYCSACDNISSGKRPGKLERVALFQHYDARCHPARHTLQQLHDCGFKLLRHMACSLDLAPLYYHLFLAMKAHFKGKHLPSDDAGRNAVSKWLNIQEQ
ncbi:hypothetical protein HPB49_014844 [Dermacentor silvarum]|uniref:Uncharacterized protein n=1 Tax=Dermacentor silvarum TaxID=543639 RepID=A0ACB8C9U8_DERSI|nr:hypothetical protein HPB49_014844 [Dermacentor silvarum]